MTGWITSLVESLGYRGILLLMFLENVVPPVPSELIMPLGGFLAGQGKLGLLGVVLAGTAGSVLGALPLYGLGRWVGQPRLCRWAERHGHWLAVSPEEGTRAARAPARARDLRDNGNRCRDKSDRRNRIVARAWGD